MSREAIPTLHADHASFRYPCGDGAIGPFDLMVEPASYHVIHGRSGCGKSTLARLLCGVIPHLYAGDFRGEVRLDGVPSTTLPITEITARVGAVFQNPEMQILRSTVGDEIDFALEHTSWSAADRATQRARTLAGFDLEAFTDRDPRCLSGGEQQRVVLAAVAARQPEVLVFDEPLAMLDSEHGRGFVEHLDALRNAGIAVVVFEHRRAPFAGRGDVRRVELPSSEEDVSVPVFPARVVRLEIRATGLSVQRRGRSVLSGGDFHWHGGEAIALHGANGSGKTTLLRALCGLEPHSGQLDVRVNGEEAPEALGLCFQSPDHQLFNASVRAEMRYACARVDEAHYDAVLTLLGLRRYEQRPPLLLSEGEKKRLALGLLLMRPGLAGLCLDEPTLGQDDANRARLGAILRQLSAAGYLCVVATHDEDWAQSWCDSAWRIASGRIEKVSR